MNTLRIGSRGSALALFQARLVAQRIVESGGPQAQIIVIRTSGDQLADRPLSEIGGKRLFVKEIEDALQANEIDLAVHSSKDMPAELPHGLDVAAVLSREDPADACVLPGEAGLDQSGPDEAFAALRTRIGAGARIGTGSVRRIAQLRAVFPDSTFENVRGNLDTRLRKLDSGGYDLLVLAAAGLRRLGFASRISWRIPFEACIPAPGQGIIAIETRIGDEEARKAAVRVNDADAFVSLNAERAVVAALGGGCQMPIGAIAVTSGSDSLELHAVVTSLDGARVIRYKKVAPKTAAAALGREVAAHLLKAGAEELLREARRHEPTVPNH